MEQRGQTPLLPDNPAPYLTDWLLEIGPTVHTGMGEAPLSIAGIAADLTALGIEIEPWEVRLIRQLSTKWIEERVLARKRDRLAPYVGFDREPETVRQTVSRKIRAAFGLPTK